MPANGSLHDRAQCPATTARIAIALLVILSVWVPLIAHHRFSAPSIDSATLKALRSGAADRLLSEIGGYKHNLVPPLGPDLTQPIDAGERFLNSIGASNPGDAGHVAYFDPERLADLNYASFLVPRTLLGAYEASGRETYLHAARHFILEWAQFERRAWVPTGLLWNDHAVAVRSVTMSEFWRHYRASPGYGERDARTFLSLVATTAARLADPSHYTYSSNHGTMQNLGLLHIALAFPELPNAGDFAALAIRRQREQNKFIFSAEGVWLEHSAGYHELGMELLGVFLRYMTLAGENITEDERDAYRRARSVYAQLRTPDGLLPRIGDTTGSPRTVEPLTTEFDAVGHALPMRRSATLDRSTSNALYADAGYSIWRSQTEQASQLSVSWSKYARHGHKHADELGLNLWTGDGRWWTGAGYWPLTHELRKKAQSWAGSNAPHLADEPEHSERQSTLRGYAWVDGAAAIDLERRGPDRFRARRQIVQVNSTIWLVLDTFDGAPDRTGRVIWGTEHDVQVKAGQFDNSYDLSKPNSPSGMSVHFLGDPETGVSMLRGSEDPFAGWVEVDYRPVPAHAFVIDARGNDAWIANTTINRASGHDLIGETRMIGWTGPDRWQLEIPTSRETIGIRRQGMTISITRIPTGVPLQLQLSGPRARPSTATQSDRFYAAAVAAYEDGFKDRIDLRRRVSFVLLLLLIAQELILRGTRRVNAPLAFALGLVSAVFWVGIGTWLYTYFTGVS